MKSKLVFALLSLFICSACLGPAEYLSVVPSTLSKGLSSDYNFHFTIDKAISHDGSLFIQFPKQYSDFTKLQECLVSVDGSSAESGPCTSTTGDQYTTIKVLEGSIAQGRYHVALSYVVNPILEDSTANFRIYTQYYDSLVEESGDFEGMAFVDAPVALNSANLDPIPPQEIRTSTKFQWEITPNTSHAVGATIRFIVPTGFSAFRPVCEAYNSNSSTVHTLYHNKALNNKTVDCLNVPFALEANNTYRFFLDSIYSPSYAGDFSGFEVQIVNPNLPQSIETAVNNTILQIKPQSMNVSPSEFNLHKNQQTELTFTISVTHETVHPGLLKVDFGAGWTLGDCTVLEGLAGHQGGSIGCSEAGGIYTISNFANAHPENPITLKFSVKAPSVSNNHSITFFTEESANKINEKVVNAIILTSSGDADILRFFALPTNSKFPQGGSQSLHFHFQLDNEWPSSDAITGEPIIKIMITPQLTLPLNSKQELKCLFYGEQEASSCVLSNNLGSSEFIVKAPANNVFKFVYLFITVVDKGTGEEVGLTFDNRINFYTARVLVTPDDNDPTKVQLFMGSFSNDKTTIEEASLTPIIRNEGVKSPFELKVTTPVKVDATKSLSIVVEFKLGSFFEHGLGYPLNSQVNVECFKSDTVGSNLLSRCKLETGNSGKNPVLHVYLLGITAEIGDELTFNIPGIALKTGTSNSLFRAWIHETFENIGILNSLTQSGFNLTHVYEDSLSTPILLISSIPFQTPPSAANDGPYTKGSTDLITFTLNSAIEDPEFVVVDFPSGFKVENMRSTGSNLFYSSYKNINQIVFSGDLTILLTANKLAILRIQTVHPTEAGSYTAFISIVKNAEIVEKYSSEFQYDPEPPAAKSLTIPTFYPINGLTVKKESNVVFLTTFVVTAIPANKCIQLKTKNAILANDEALTCETTLPGKYICTKFDSNTLEIKNYDALVGASNSVNVNFALQIGTLQPEIEYFTVFNNSDCTGVYLQTTKALDNPLVIQDPSLGFNVNQNVQKTIRKGDKAPLVVNLEVSVALEFGTIQVDIPSCLEIPSNYLTCFNGKTPVGCEKNGEGVLVSVSTVLGPGNHEISVSSLNEAGGDGLVYNCDGTLQKISANATLGSNTVKLTNFFRVLPQQGGLKSLSLQHLIKNQGFSKGIVEISVKTTEELLAYSANPGNALFFIINNVVGQTAFQTLLATSNVQGQQVSCCGMGHLQSETGKKIECYATSVGDSTLIEVKNFDAASNAVNEFSLTLSNVENAATANGAFTVELLIFHNTDEVKNNLVAYHLSHGNTKDLESATPTTGPETYGTPLAFSSGSVVQAGDITLVGSLPAMTPNAQTVFVTLPDGFTFENSHGGSITCPTATTTTYSACYILDSNTAKYVIDGAGLASGAYDLKLEGVKIPGKVFSVSSLNFETSFMDTNGIIQNVRTHQLTQAELANLYQTITEFDFRPFGSQIDDSNFVNQKLDIWGHVNFTTTQPLVAGSQILIEIDSQYNFNDEHCFAVEGSVLQSSYSSSHIKCQKLSQNELLVFVEKAISAGEVKLNVNLKSVSNHNGITFTVSTYSEAYNSGNVLANLVEKGTSTFNKLNPTTRYLHANLDSTFIPKQFIKPNSKFPLSFTLELTQTYTTDGLIQVLFPQKDVVGNGNGFTLAAGNYKCYAYLAGKLFPHCNVVFNATKQEANITFNQGITATQELTLVFLHDSQLANELEIEFPATAGRYQLEVNYFAADNVTISKHYRWDFLVVKDSIDNFSSENLFTNSQLSTAFKVNFGHSQNITAGKIVIGIHVYDTLFTPFDETKNGNAIDFLEKSGKVTGCKQYATDEEDHTNHHLRQFHCTNNEILANEDVELILFFKNVPTANVHESTVTLEIYNESNEVLYFNVAQSGYETVGNVALSGVPPGLVTFVEADGTTTPVPTDKNFDIVFTNQCGGLVTGSYLHTKIAWDYSPAGTLTSDQAEVVFVPSAQGVFFKLTSNLANGADLKVGPFVNKQGFVTAIPANILICPNSVTPSVQSSLAAPFVAIDLTGTSSLVPTSLNENANVDAILTIQVIGQNIVQVQAEIGGIFASNVDADCFTSSGNEISNIKSCKVTSNRIVVVFSSAFSGDSVLKIRTFGGVFTSGSGAVTVNYGVYLFTAESTYAAPDATTENLYAYHAYPFNGNFANPQLVLSSEGTEFDWQFDLVQSFPNAAFLQLEYKPQTFGGITDGIVEFVLPANVYSLDTTFVAGNYTGTLLCSVSGKPYACSVTYSSGTFVEKIIIPNFDLDATYANPLIFKVAFYSFQWNGFQVAQSQYQFLTVFLKNNAGTEIGRYESNYFFTNPNLLEPVSVLHAHSFGDVNNYFEITIDRANVVVEENYRLIVELERKGFGVQDGLDGSSIPCTDLSGVNSNIRCIYVAGQANANSNFGHDNSRIVVEGLKTAQGASLKLGLTGIKTLPFSGTENLKAVMNFHLYHTNNTLVGIQKTTIFQIQSSTAETVAGVIASMNGKYNVGGIDYTITTTNDDFVNDQWVCYELDAGAGEQFLVLTPGQGEKLLSGFAFEGGIISKSYLWKKITLAADSATYNSKDFFAKKPNAAAQLKLKQFTNTKVITIEVTSPTDAANKVATLTQNQLVGFIKHSVNTTVPSNTGNKIYTKILLSPSELYGNPDVNGAYMVRGASVTVNFGGPVPNLVSGDECWVDSRLFESMDAKNPVKCTIDTTLNAVVITSFDRVYLARSATIVLKHNALSTATASGTTNQVTLKYYAAGETVAAGNHFLEFSSVDLAVENYDNTPAINDKVTNSALNVINATAWEFVSTIDFGATSEVETLAIHFKGIDFPLPDRMLMDRNGAIWNCVQNLNDNFFLCSYNGGTFMAPSSFGLKLILLWDQTFQIPYDNMDIFFAFIDVKIKNGALLKYQNIAFACNEQLPTVTNGIAENNDIVSFLHGYYEQWNEVKFKLDGLKLAVNIDNYLVFELIGGSSNKFSNGGIPCEVTYNGTAADAECVYQNGRSVSGNEGTPFSNSVISLLPKNEIPKGTNIEVALILDNPTLGNGMYTHIRVLSIKRYNNFAFNELPNAFAFQTFTVTTVGKATSSPTSGSLTASYAENGNSNEFSFVDTSPAGMASGNVLVVDFGKALTISDGHDLAADLAKYRVNSDPQVNFASSKLYTHTNVGTVLFAKFATPAANSVILSTSQLLAVLASGNAFSAFVFGTTSNKFLSLAAPVTIAPNAGQGVVLAQVSQLYGSLYYNRIGVFKVTFSSGDFDISQGQLIQFETSFNRLTPAAGPEFCAAYDANAKTKFICTYDRSSNNKITIGSFLHNKVIPANTQIVVYISGYVTTAFTDSYGANFNSGDTRYAIFKFSNSLTFADSYYLTTDNWFSKIADKAISTGKQGLKYSFTLATGFTDSSIAINDPNIQGTPECWIFSKNYLEFGFVDWPEISAASQVECSYSSNVLTVSDVDFVGSQNYILSVYAVPSVNRLYKASEIVDISSSYTLNSFTITGTTPGGASSITTDVKPYYPGKLDSTNADFFATSLEAGSAVPLIFNFQSLELSAATDSRIEVHFTRPSGACANCWANDQTLFTPNVNNGDKIECFIAANAHDKDTISDLSNNGNAPECYYHTNEGHGIVRILGIGSVSANAKLTIVLYNVNVNANNKFNQVELRIYPNANTYQTLKYSNILNSVTAGTPYTTDLSLSLADANQNLLGVTNVTSSVSLNVAVDDILLKGSLILFQLPTVLSGVSENLKGINYTTRGNNLTVKFYDSKNNRVLLHVDENVNMTTTHTGLMDFKLANVNHAGAVCTGCSNGKLTIFLSGKIDVNSLLVYPDVIKPETADGSFQQISRSLVQGQLALIEYTLHIGSYVSGTNTVNVQFVSGDSQFLECSNAVSGNQTANNCFVYKKGTSSQVTVLSVEGPTLKFNALILVGASIPNLQYQVVNSEGTVLQDETEVFDYGTIPALTEGSSNFGTYYVLERLYELKPLKHTLAASSSVLRIGLFVDFDLSSSSNDIILENTAGNDLLGVVGQDLTCQYVVYDGNQNIVRIVKAVSCSQTSGAIWSKGPIKDIPSTGTLHFELQVRKDSGDSFPLISPNVEFYTVRTIGNSIDYKNTLQFHQEPCVLPFVTGSSINLQESGTNFIEVSFRTGGVVPAYASGNKRTYVEIEFLHESFGTSILPSNFALDLSVSNQWPSKQSGETCQQTENVLYHGGQQETYANSNAALFFLLANDVNTTETSHTVFVPFVKNGAAGKNLAYKVNVYQYDPANPIPVKLFEGTVSNEIATAAATLTNGVLTSALSSNTFGDVNVQANLGFPNPAQIPIQNVGLVLASNKPEAIFGNENAACSANVVGYDTSFFGNSNKAIYVLKANDAISIGTKSLTLRGLNIPGFANDNYDFELHTFGAGVQTGIFLATSLTFSTLTGSGNHSLSHLGGHLNIGSQSHFAVSILYNHTISSGGKITILLPSQLQSSANVYGQEICVVSGLQATSGNVVNCWVDSGSNALVITGYADVAAGTAISVQFLAKVTDAANLYVGITVKNSADQTILSNSQVGTVTSQQGSSVTASFPSLNSQTLKLYEGRLEAFEFTLKMRTNTFETANALNNFVIIIPPGEADVVTRQTLSIPDKTKYLTVYYHDGSNWKVVSHSIDEPTGFFLKIELKNGETFIMGTTYKFKVVTNLFEGDSGFGLQKTKGLTSVTASAYDDTTLVESSIDQVLVGPKPNSLQFSFQPLLNGKISSGLYLLTFTTTFEIYANDILALWFPTRDAYGNSIWKEDLGIDQGLITSGDQYSVPCERYFGETVISTSAIECKINPVSSHGTNGVAVEFVPTQTIAANAEVKVVFYGIQTPNVTKPPVKFSLRRADLVPFKIPTHHPLSESTILLDLGESLAFQYADNNATSSATDLVTGDSSVHTHVFEVAVNTTGYIIFRYPTALLSLNIASNSITTNAITLQFTGSNIAAYKPTSNETSFDLKLTGTNAAVVTVVLPDVLIEVYGENNSGHKITGPVQLQAFGNPASIVYFEQDFHLIASNQINQHALSQNRTNFIIVVLSGFFEYGTSQFIQIDGEGISGFGSYCKPYIFTGPSLNQYSDPIFDCEVTSNTIKLTPSASYNNFEYKGLTNGPYNIHLNIEVQTFGISADNIVLNFKRFVSGNTFDQQLKIEQPFFDINPPTVSGVAIGNYVDLGNPVTNFRLLYKPASDANITNFKVQLPNDLTPLPISNINLQCQVYGDALLENSTCEVNELGLINVNFPSINNTRFFVNFLNGNENSKTLLVPNKFANNFNVSFSANNEEIVETDSTTLNPIYNSALAGGLFTSIGLSQDQSQFALLNLTTGTVKIASGVEASSVHSQIIIEFPETENFDTNVNPSSNGDYIGCLQLDKTVLLKDQNQPQSLKCQYFSGDANKNSKIVITGHGEIPAESSNFAFLLTDIQSVNVGQSGKVYVSVLESNNGIVGYSHLKKLISSTAIANTVASTQSKAFAMTKNDNGTATLEFVIDTASLNEGEYILLNFGSQLYRDNIEMGVYTDLDCLKVFNFPVKRQIGLYATCDIASNGNTPGGGPGGPGGPATPTLTFSLKNFTFNPEPPTAASHVVSGHVVNSNAYVGLTFTLAAAGAPPAPVQNATMFSVSFETLIGGQTDTYFDLRMQSDNEYTSDAWFDVAVPIEFGDLTSIHPFCEGITYSETTCEFTANKIRVKINNPQNFDWRRLVQVRVKNVNNPNGSPSDFDLDIYYHHDSAIVFQATYTPPTFSNDVLDLCTVTASTIYNNTGYSGDLKVTVTCPETIRPNSTVYIVLPTESSLSGNYPCSAEGLHLKSSSCAFEAAGAPTDSIKAVLEPNPSVNSFSITLKNLNGWANADHGVDIQIFTNGYKYAKELNTAIFETKSTIVRLADTAYTASLYISNRNPTHKASYIFQIPHNSDISLVTQAKISLGDQFKTSMTGITCSIKKYETTSFSFNLTEYILGNVAFSPITCTVENNVITIQGIQSYLDTDGLLLALHNVVNPAFSLDADFGFEFVISTAFGNFLKWKNSQSFFLTLVDIPKALVVQQILPSTTNIKKQANHVVNFTVLHSAPIDNVTLSLTMNSAFSASGVSSCKQDFLDNAACGLSSLSPIEVKVDGSTYGLEQRSRNITLLNIANPSSNLDCSTVNDDIYHLKIKQRNTDNLIYKTYHVLNKNKNCISFADQRIPVRLTGPTTIKAGVLNKFTLSVDQLLPNTQLTYSLSISQAGFTVSKTNFAFSSDNKTSYDFTIIRAQDNTVLPLAIHWTSTNADDYQLLPSPHGFAVVNDPQYYTVTLNPVYEINYRGLIYYYELAISEAPVNNLTISISTLQAEVQPLQSSVVLNENNQKALLGFRVKDEFNQANVIIDFAISQLEGSLATYQLAERELKVPVKNLKNNALQMSSVDITKNGNAFTLVPTFNHPVEVALVTVIKGTPAPSNASFQAFTSGPHVSTQSVKTLQSQSDIDKFIGETYQVSGLYAFTNYTVHILAYDGKNYLTTSVDVLTSGYLQAYNLIVEFSNPVSTTDVLNAFINAVDTTGVNITLTVLSSARLLQSIDPFIVQLTIVPLPNSGVNAQDVANQLNSQAAKNIIGAQFPEFWTGQNLGVTPIPFNVPTITTSPAVFNYTYYNVSTTAQLSGPGGLYALAIQRVNNSQPKYTYPPSGILIQTKIENSGSIAGTYATAKCATDAQNNCAIHFDDLKSGSAYDFYYIPYAQVPYEPEPIGQQVESVTFTSPVNPFVEKQ